MQESTTTQHEKEETAKKKHNPELEHDLLIAEYNSLAAEKLQRIVQRYQLVGLTLLALGTILGLKDTNLLLLFPTLSFFLLLIYTGNIRATDKIDEYIKTSIESEVGKANFGWHTFRVDKRGDHSGEVVYSGNRLFFVTCSVIALLAGILLSPQEFVKPFKLILAAIAVVFSILTLVLALYPDQSYKFMKKVLKKNRMPRMLRAEN